MTYNTFSPQTPQSGGFNTGHFKIVPSNPGHPTSEASNYPSYYDQFVNKTNINYASYLNIADETHPVSAVILTPSSTYAGYIYTHHRIAQGSTIATTDGTIATSATNYNNGIIYFSVAPTVQFTITYIATPDAYFGDHINALQNAVMKIEQTVGGPSGGLRNARYWLASGDSLLPNAINIASMPTGTNPYIKSAPGASNTVTIGNGADGLTLDLRYLTVTNTDVSYAISGRIGDSKEDKFFVNGLVHIEPSGGTGAIINTNIGTGVVFAVGNPLQSVGSGYSAIAGPYAFPTTAVTGSLIARLYGDVQILGTLWVSGGTVAVAGSTGSFNSFTTNVVVGSGLYVSGNTTLGSDSNKITTINGTASISRSLHVKALSNDVSRFDGSIDVRNPGNINNGVGGPYSDAQLSRGTEAWPDLPYYIGTNLRSAPGSFTDLTVNKNTTFDGLDPSYIAKLLRRRAFERHDYKHNMVNDCRRDGLAGTVATLAGAGTSSWYASGYTYTGYIPPFNTTTGHNQSVVTSVSTYPWLYGTKWFHLGGNYYHGKFMNRTGSISTGEHTGNYIYGDGNQWHLKWTTDDTTSNVNPGAFKYGADIPLDSMMLYHTGVSPWQPTGALVTISRPFNTPVAAGNTFKLYHPYHSKPYGIMHRASNASAIVYATDIEPIIANINGIYKEMTSSCTHDLSALGAYTGNVFFYIDLDTPQIAKQGLVPGALLETQAQSTYDTVLKETDTRVALGEVFYNGSAISDYTAITYAPNARHDTLWIRTQATGSIMLGGTGEFSWFHRGTGNVGTGTSTGSIENTTALLTPNSTDYATLSQYHPSQKYIGDTLVDNTRQYKVRVQHNIGVWERINNTKMKVLVSPDLGIDQPYAVSGSTVVYEGPDYAYVNELPQVKFTNGVPAATAYPCYEIIQQDRLFTDLVIYNAGEIPGLIITNRGTTNIRNLTLTGSAGSNNLTGANVAERNRGWWWTRIVIE